MKPILPTSTTKATPKVDVDKLKVQLKKGLNINIWCSGSSTGKSFVTSESKGKEKGVQVEPTEEEKKRLQYLEL